MRRRPQTVLTCLAAGALVLAGCSADAEPEPSPSPTPSPTGADSGAGTTGVPDTGEATTAAPEQVEAALPEGTDPIARAEFTIGADGTPNTTVDLLGEPEEGVGYDVLTVCSGDAGSTVEYEVLPSDEQAGQEAVRGPMTAVVPCGTLRRDSYIPPGSPVPESPLQISLVRTDDGVSSASAVVVPSDRPGPGD